MIKSTVFLVWSLLVAFSWGEPILYDTCYLSTNSDGPRSVNLTKTENSMQLDIDFFAYHAGPNLPLKIKRIRRNINYSTALINVLYPLTISNDSHEYKEYHITIPVPQVEPNNDDSLQFSLHKLDPATLKEEVIWCFGISIKALYGIQDTPKPLIYPIVAN